MIGSHLTPCPEVVNMGQHSMSLEEAFSIYKLTSGKPTEEEACAEALKLIGRKLPESCFAATYTKSITLPYQRPTYPNSRDVCDEGFWYAECIDCGKEAGDCEHYKEEV